MTTQGPRQPRPAARPLLRPRPPKRGKRSATVVVLAGAVAVAVFGSWLLTRQRGPTLPGSDGLGFLPPIPAETRSVEQLEAATTDPSSAVRREALRSLGRLEDHRRLAAPRVLPFLTRGAEDADASVRAVATAYLGQVRVDPASVVPTLSALVDDDDALVRANAVRALGLRQAAARDALPRLVKALSDTDRSVRVNAYWALLYFPEARFDPPADWKGLTAEAAKALAPRLGVSVTPEGLIRAVSDNDVAGVFVLLRAGLDPNTRNPETKAGETPLFRAGGCRPEIVRYLLDAGADVQARDSFGRTPWQWAEGAKGVYAEEVLRMLREAAAAQ